MKMTASGIAKIAAAVVGAAVTSAASAWAGAAQAHSEHGAQLDGLLRAVHRIEVSQGRLEGDVRLLKCAAAFPGDCPGQAKVPAP